MRGRVLRHHHRRLRQFHLHHTAQHRLLFTDETTAPVLDPGRRRVKKGQLWGYARELNAPRAQLTAPSRQARVARSRRSRSRMRLCCSPTRGRNNNGVQTANRDQSSGNEPAAPGLMSFHKVTLPSAPNLYSSVPPFGRGYPSGTAGLKFFAAAPAQIESRRQCWLKRRASAAPLSYPPASGAA